MANARNVDLSALDRLRVRLGRLGTAGIDANAEPLMVSWMKIVTADNRRGVLAGLDKDGREMESVKYRPVGRARKTTAAQRNVARGRGGAYAGFGMYAAGLHNNLSREEYERLGGPPLAPRGANSRVITNFKTDYDRLRPGFWQVTYWWDDVVSTKGVPFLRAHFTGAAVGRGHKVRLPVRDLRGIRPEGRALARKAAVKWALDLIRSHP